jgi:small conductance mechanosensitive channel
MIVFFSFIILKIEKRLISNFIEKNSENKRADTIIIIFGKIITYVIYFFAGSELIQNLFNIKATTFLAATGVLGVSIGLGAQSLIKDIIYGFFIIFENQYMVGEKVTIEKFTGEVIEMGIRLTRIKNDSGDVFMISNGLIGSVVNHSREEKKI